MFPRLLSPRILAFSALGLVAACGNGSARPVEAAVIPAPPSSASPAARAVAADDPPAAPAPESDPKPATPAPQGDTCGLKATLREVTPKNEGGYALTLTNNGKKAVILVVPGDGSEAGWRTPEITWIATSNGKPGVREEGGRCGMMNAIASVPIRPFP